MLKHKMGLLLAKKITLFFLLISASLLSISLAGRQLDYANHKVSLDAYENEEMLGKASMNEKEMAIVHERLLRVNTKDYGRYDPTPALVKPPFKLIPN